MGAGAIPTDEYFPGTIPGLESLAHTDGWSTSYCSPPRLAVGCSGNRLQAGARMPRVDLHPSDHTRSQAHSVASGGHPGSQCRRLPPAGDQQVLKDPSRRRAAASHSQEKRSLASAGPIFLSNGV
jgi:hypothetical protein